MGNGASDAELRVTSFRVRGSYLDLTHRSMLVFMRWYNPYILAMIISEAFGRSKGLLKDKCLDKIRFRESRFRSDCPDFVVNTSATGVRVQL